MLDFNIFVFGDHEESNTDCEGRVAVGGSCNYENYSIGTKLVMSYTRNDLIVNKGVYITNATNKSGNTAVADSSLVKKYGMTHENKTILGY